MKIDTNVPMPESVVRNSYPYREMQVGESFLVIGVRLETMLNTNWRWGKKMNRRYVARTEGAGVRVWRVE